MLTSLLKAKDALITSCHTSSPQKPAFYS